MAGIAATFGAPESALNAISAALARRGAEPATWRAGATRLLVRASMPAVHEHRGVALAVDGIAEVSALAAEYASRGPAGLVAAEPGTSQAGYASRGPAGLVAAGPGTSQAEYASRGAAGHGAEPYALILADPARGALVLARNGDGPPLYYAGTAGGVMVASEPGALLAAGVPAEPDEGVVGRFVATGACDDTAATFYAGIRRVLPGEVVEIAGGTRTRKLLVARDGAGRFARSVLDAAIGRGRIGVRFGHGLAGAATVGAALTGAEGRRALSVYSATFPGLTTAAADFASAVLGPVPAGGVRHRAQPHFADELDLDGLLADLGEPVPDLDSYLTWATARATAGEVDTLIDTSGGGAHLARVADRLESRYGVTVRFPLRALPSAGPVLRAELTAIVEGTLPLPAAKFATAHAAHSLLPPMREVLVRMRAELAAALLDPQLPGAGRASWDALAGLFGGARVDAGTIFRRYIVERWLRTLGPPPRAQRPRRASRAETRAAGAQWTRVPIPTEVFRAGDKLPEKVAWYVSECLAGLGRRAYRRGRWHVLLAAQPVAVVQGRTRPVWEIRPGAVARALHRWARPAAGLHDPWTAQVAVERVGPLRAAVGPSAAHGVRGPRPGGVHVVLPPEEPARVAAEVVAALRTAVPEEAFATFGGCAIVAGGGVAGVAGELDAALAAGLCADDPLATDPLAVVLSGSPAKKGQARPSRGAGRR